MLRNAITSLLCCAMLAGLAAGQATTTSRPAATTGARPSSEVRPSARTGVLEFRIAPYAPGTEEGAMSESDRDHHVEMLTKEGPEPARRRNEPYLWFPLREQSEKVGAFIVADYAGRSYVLLSNQPADVMLQGTGAEAWGLKDVFPDTDVQGRPAVGFEFDPRGGKRFGELTSAHIGQTLALLVDNEVCSSPRIRSVITSRGIIEGNFTSEEVRRMVRSLRAGSVKARTTSRATSASAPATRKAPDTRAARAADVFVGKVVDAQGQPVVGATVGLYRFDAEESPFLPRLKVIATTTTQADGTFELTYVPTHPAILGVVARKEGLALDWEMFNPGRDRPKEVVLTLAAGGGPLGGVVVDESGAPIAGAQVCAMLVIGRDRPEKMLYPCPDIPTLVAETDAAGRFTVRDLPAAASVGFRVSAAGKASTVTVTDGPPFLPYSLDSKDIKIVMQPQATLTGLVVDATTGQGVDGVRVQATPATPGLRRGGGGGAAISDAQGRFTFTGLTPGEYSLVVRPKEETAYVARPVSATAGVGQAGQDVRIELIQGTPLEVTVVLKDGEPVREAGVYAHPTDGSGGQSRTTDDRGIVAIHLPPGEYRISAYKEGYIPAEGAPAVTIIQDRPQKMRIELTTLPKIRGVVRDPSGNPVAGAAVRVLPHWQEAKTAADGTFTAAMDPLSGVEPKLLIRDPKRDLATLADVPEPGQAIEVVLAPAMTLACTVTDPSDKPIFGAWVQASLRIERYSSPLDPERTATDADGRCQIKAVPAGANAIVTAEAAGYGMATQQVQLAQGGSGTETLEPFVLQEAHERLSGVVVDLDDKPVSGARVFASGPGQPDHQTTTDKDGKFTLDELVPGTVRIHVFKQTSGQAGQSGTVTAQAGDTDVKVVMGQQGRAPVQAETRPPSLVGKPLPDLAALGLADAAKTLAGRSVLVCFFELDQRPSRRLVLALTAKAEEMRDKGVAVLLVQAAAVERDRLDAWTGEQKVSFPVGMMPGEGEKARAARAKWGAAALPWMILTDARHQVVYEGSSLADLEAKLAAPTSTSAPATQAGD